MANYFNQFAAVFVPHNAAQAQYIREAFAAADDEDEEAIKDWAEATGAGDIDDCFLSGIDFIEEEPDEGQTMPTFVFSSDEGGVPDHIAELIAAAQTKFDDPRPWSVESAFTCDKQREDGFGGQAVLVHDGVCTYWSTQQWLSEQFKAIATPDAGKPTGRLSCALPINAIILPWKEMGDLIEQYDFVGDDGLVRFGLIEEPWPNESAELQLIVPDKDGDPDDIRLYPQCLGTPVVIRRVGDRLSFDYGDGDCDTYTIILKERVPDAERPDFSATILVLEEHAARYSQIAQHVPLGGAAVVCNACAMAANVLRGHDPGGWAWLEEVGALVRAAVTYGVLGVATHIDPVEYAAAIALLDPNRNTLSDKRG